jgi:hypothetical protein
MTLVLVLSLPGQVRAQPSINNTTWFGALYQSSFTDPYYGVYSLHAFTAGSTVTLFVTVQAQAYFSGNSTYVWSVSFKSDWGQVYFSGNAFPQVIPPGSTYTFKITFSAPDVSTASNLYTHSGTIDVNYSTSSTGLRNDQNSNACGYGSGCYVTYSTDQVTDTRIMQRFGSSSLGGLACGSLAGFTTPKANYLCLSAAQTAQNGTLRYASGDFSGAVPILQQANTLLNQAISAENDASTQQAATANTFDIVSFDIPIIAAAVSILVASIIIASSLRKRSMIPVANSRTPTGTPPSATA